MISSSDIPRSAGLLLHITSLPSPFGMGDLGEEAYKFARFLFKSKQQWWQILPLNPTDLVKYPSPYSSNSSMAGNPYLISPELLADEGLLEVQELREYKLAVKSEADFIEGGRVKNILFDKAYRNFIQEDHYVGKQEFEEFCLKEAYWLQDYALFLSLKNEFKGAAWFAWPDEFRLRDKKALDNFSRLHQDEINQIKWLQWVFYSQWKKLKEYCNKLNVKFFGDMPFYVGHDSADIWANPSIFRINKDGSPTHVAGCPPDYFSVDGQRWGMPVFNWEVLKNQKYEWWFKRLAKNLELFDLLRLDHFMAFSRYWEIKAEEPTARNGQWVKGPGAEFFNFLKEKWGALPFVAEDLGACDESVYNLRDQFSFPGMKILQFAFGVADENSIHLPHFHTPNFIVYSGNHDTNTTRGWFGNETGKKDQKKLKKYCGIRVTEKNAAEVLSKMAYASPASIAILPVQDVLNLDEDFRMNVPGTTENNWVWRLEDGQLTKGIQRRLKEWVKLYGRGA